mmetsp:Transcript_8862/g.13225  ORF Transcript_8862/g.13225 Transcript_8862/m.13225 type:complete len:124 (+) Transcript_8862:55-426(+)
MQGYNLTDQILLRNQNNLKVDFFAVVGAAGVFSAALDDATGAFAVDLEATTGLAGIFDATGFAGAEDGKKENNPFLTGSGSGSGSGSGAGGVYFFPPPNICSSGEGGIFDPGQLKSGIAFKLD